MCAISLMMLMAGNVTAAGEPPTPESEPGTREELGCDAVFGALVNVTGRDRIRFSLNR